MWPTWAPYPERKPEQGLVTVVRRPVVKRCPYRDETDAGELVITIPAAAPELHELGRLVDQLCQAGPVSHEEFTRRVAALLAADSTVVTRWTTGPWQVEVTVPAESET